MKYAAKHITDIGLRRVWKGDHKCDLWKKMMLRDIIMFILYVDLSNFLVQYFRIIPDQMLGLMLLLGLIFVKFIVLKRSNLKVYLLMHIGNRN